MTLNLCLRVWVFGQCGPLLRAGGIDELADAGDLLLDGQRGRVDVVRVLGRPERCDLTRRVGLVSPLEVLKNGLLLA